MQTRDGAHTPDAGDIVEGKLGQPLSASDEPPVPSMTTSVAFLAS
jgi:hypothetical protein